MFLDSVYLLIQNTIHTRINCAIVLCRLMALSDELLLKLTRARSLNAVTVLSLHGNGLIRLKHLQALTLLKRLTVSGNDLTKLDDLAGMVSYDWSADM